MPFDPSTIQGVPSDTTTPDPSPKVRGFDPSTARPAPSRQTSAGSSIGNAIGQTARGALDIPTGVARGLAGDVLGASQLATDIGVPTSKDDPIEGWLKRFSQAPSKSWGDTAGRVVGGAIPAFLGNPIAAGAATGAVQPTKKGDLLSHAIGGVAGGAGGAVAGALGGTPAVRAMRDLGVRITPWRTVPLVGREVERFAARLPVLNRLIGHGRQVSLDDFQQALYRDAWEPLGGNPPVTGAGSEGLDQLRTAITGRLNGVLQRSTVRGGPGTQLETDLGQIQADATHQLNDAQLRRFGAIIRDDVTAPLGRNNWTLTGQRLAGGGGVVGRLGALSRQFWQAGARGDSQEAALGDMVRRVQQAILDNAQIGGLGRGELDAARQAYARYSTLSRAGSGVRAEGRISPDDLLSEIRRGHTDLFSRGQLRLQPMAEQARRAGVPTVAETHPEVSPWETVVGTGAGLGASHLLSPNEGTAAAIGALAPALLYNRPAMSVIQALSRIAPGLASTIGAAAGQVDPTGGVTP